MTEKRTSEVPQFVLPFWVMAENRKEPLTQDMAKAAVFCLAELERAKGGGIILKQPAEKLAFIAQSYYPFWLVPWDELNLLFDGLGTSAYTLHFKPVPDAKAFTGNAERSSRTLEAYSAFLSDNTNYFQPSTSTKEVVLKGLITDKVFLNEVDSYFKEAKQVEAPPDDATMLSLTLEEPEYSSVMSELDNLKSTFTEEKDALYECMKLVNAVTRDFTKAIRAKMKKEKDEFDEQIKKLQAIVKPRVDQINEEYDGRIAKLTKDFDRQLLPLQKEKVKFEKSREETLGKIERYKTEAKTAATRKDAVAERKWKERTDEAKKELSGFEAKIKDFQSKIKSVEDARTTDTFKLRSEWEAKVREAEKDVLELEASCDARMQFHGKEIEKLETPTSAIIGQINSMAKMRETDLAGFGKLGFGQKQAATTLMYVPLYLVCYRHDSKRRYMTLAPSMVNSISLFTKLKGALGRARIKQLVSPRFKAITQHLNKLLSTIERNPVLEREITESSVKVDILRMASVRSEFSNSLKQLKEEGWLSEKEHEAFAEAYRKTSV